MKKRHHLEERSAELSFQRSVIFWTLFCNEPPIILEGQHLRGKQNYTLSYPLIFMIPPASETQLSNSPFRNKW